MNTVTSKTNKLPRIVIVGGGAGGLELTNKLAKKLGKNKSAEIILIDQSPFHLWKPMLHEVAAGTLTAFGDELNYLYYASTHHFTFCLGAMQNLNRAKKEILLQPVIDANNQTIIPSRSIKYDILIIAVGSVTNDYHIPGVKEYCLTLDSIENANDARKKIFETLTRFAWEKPDQSMPLAIIGGGATGIELAAELHYAIAQMANYSFGLHPEKVSISLIEGGNRLLPALPDKISADAAKKLEQLGIKVYTDEAVSAITPEGVQTKSGKLIPAILTAWTAGIKAPEFLAHLDGLEVNKLNQLVVKNTLQTTLDDSVFALGDCAYFVDAKNPRGLPALAQVAHQQASFLYKAIQCYLNNKSLPCFQYHYFGSLVSLSHYETVGTLMSRLVGNIMVQGFFARIMYLSLFRMHQNALYGPWRVFILILVDALTKKIRPLLKMH